MIETCRATVSHPPYYIHSIRCSRPGKYDVGGYKVCGTHARVARKWESEGRLPQMVAVHWRER